MSEKADVLIVGAGASAGVAARHLAEAGYSVICLEQGDWPDRSAYRGSEPDWELAARKQWSSSPNVRQRWADYPIDFSASEMGTGNFNGVGGGTVLYNGVWPRMLPSDFMGGSIDGATEDWPFRYEDLQPYYERTDREFGVSGLGGNPIYPPGEDPPLPPLPIGRGGLMLARAHSRLGWHWWPEYNAILSAPYDGRNPCVQRGTCPSGCNEGAKASTDLTHFPRAAAAGARVITGARVRNLPVDRAGLVTGAEWLDPEGNEHFQPADVVLCAANGIGTPRLLLLSTSSRFPDGLANTSGLVGRRLMMHPCVLVTGLFDAELESWQGHFGGAIQTLEFYGSDASRGFVRGAKWSLAPTGGPVGIALPRHRDPVLGAEHHGYVRDRFGKGASWIILCQDLPNEENRVELSTVMVDSSGLPAPKLVYHVSDNSTRMKAWMIERAQESLTESGAWHTDAVDALGNSHQMGTVRMGDDPATSVVNQWGIAHDVPNLGVIDGSVFVTAGAVNPTSTIAALALRSVEHLIATRRWTPIPTRNRSVVVPSTRQTPRAAPQQRGFDAQSLTPVERAGIVVAADALIPGNDSMPAPSHIGIGTDLLDWVVDSRPDLLDLIRHAATHIAADGTDVHGALASLRTRDRASYDALVLVVVAGYYHHPEVRRMIGYPGQVARPVRALDFPEYLTEGLLDSVLNA